MRPRFTFLACLAWASCAQIAARADTVQTVEARLSGKMALRGNAILMDGVAVPLDTVVSAVRDSGANTFGAPHAVRLRNGEIWRGGILGLESNRLTVVSDLFGRRTIGTESVASLDFECSTGPGSLRRAGTLYREKGEPIPGTILWIGEDMLTMDCPLGILTVPRKGTLCYLFDHAASPSTAESAEEIGLIDGSIIRGRLSLSSNGLEVTHALLGVLSVPGPAVRYVVRSPPGWMRLGPPAAGDVELRGPAGPPAAPRLVDYRRDVESRPRATCCLTAVRMQAVTVAQYRLPERKGRDATFHAMAAPAPGCRGDVRIVLRVSGVRVYERLLVSTNEPVAVSIALPPGDTLTLEVEFGERLLYPCGVDWQDPCIVFQNAALDPDT